MPVPRVMCRDRAAPCAAPTACSASAAQTASLSMATGPSVSRRSRSRMARSVKAGSVSGLRMMPPASIGSARADADRQGSVTAADLLDPAGQEGLDVRRRRAGRGGDSQPGQHVTGRRVDGHESGAGAADVDPDDSRNSGTRAVVGAIRRWS